MYCPNCGNENPDEQKYCRACGCQLPVLLPVPSKKPGSERMERLVGAMANEVKGWRAPLIYAGVLFVAGLTVTLIGQKVFHDKTAADLGTVIALIGVLVLLLKGLLVVAMPYSDQWQKHTGQPESRQLGTPETTSEPQPKLLSAEPPSITETTTRQLDGSTVDGARPRDAQPTR